MTTTTTPTIERLPVDEAFAIPADAAALDRAAEGLRARGFDAHVVPNGLAARELLLSLVPAGAQVGEGASATLDQIGVTEIIEKSGRYEAVRLQTRAMDRQTQAGEIRRLSNAPDFQINSVHALTEKGEMLIASATGSQLGPIVSGAGRVILVVGAQKVVPDLATAYRRLDDYAFPMEDARAQQAYGMHSSVRKTLVLQGDFPGRTSVIIVREAVGV
jgi:hypothetical protein